MYGVLSMQPILRKNFNKNFNIGSVLNEVARVVKLLQTVLVPECTVLLLVLHSTSIGSE